MSRFLLRLLINAVALMIAADVVNGITIRENSVAALLLVALIFGMVNATIKPILTVLTCPFILLTMGLFLLVINGAMLLITDWLAGNWFEVDGWGPAIIGGLIMGIAGLFIEMVLGELKEDEKEKRSD